MLGFKILMASALLTLVLTGGMAFAVSLLDTDSTSSENDTENNTATSNSGVEQVTVKAQLKPTGLLDGWYDINLDWV
jgi:hypothetical protein